MVSARKLPERNVDARNRGTAPAGSNPLDLFTTLARTGLFLDALQRECLGEHGLTFAEFSVLRLLQRAPSRRRAPSFLAKEIVCTTGAMTKLVDRLERNDWVERLPDPSDRRGILVRLTKEGAETATKASSAYRARRRRVLADMSEKETDRIQKSLEHLLEALELERNDA